MAEIVTELSRQKGTLQYAERLFTQQFGEDGESYGGNIYVEPEDFRRKNRDVSERNARKRLKRAGYEARFDWDHVLDIRSPLNEDGSKSVVTGVDLCKKGVGRATDAASVFTKPIKPLATK